MGKLPSGSGTFKTQLPEFIFTLSRTITQRKMPTPKGFSFVGYNKWYSFPQNYTLT